MLLKISLTLIIFSFLSCEEESNKKEEIVAQVGKSKLTKNELDDFLASKKGSIKFKEEYIKDWIETELLYQLAFEEKLVTKENYYRIIRESEKKLASSIAINNLLENHQINYTEDDLVDFYNSNKEDFIFGTDAFILNLISFKSEENAINFRNNAIENNWDEALTAFENSEELIDNYVNKVYRSSQIHSNKLLRVLMELFQDEISLVVETEPNNFVVVQMIDKVDRSTIPQFDYVKDRVKESYIFNSQKEMLKQFLDSLKLERKVKVF
ncbi:MAG: peptidyl-prolyl cis-trans isomerase [Ignavibacteriae bacterium]|nr:peptidyl-prolyl cis-trans isomerase [Ignavibacteriota bacterium]